jgi:TolB-like protein/Flp pilus assembly protein TadD
VRYFVEGSVRRLGDNVRITVQLDDTASGNQVWGKRYDSPLDELFALEEELVQTIAGTVSGRIEHDAKLSSMQKPANDMRAYDYLMRGKHLLEKFNAVDIRKAREQFVKCLEIDANNAEAHTQFAVTHAVELFENWSADRQASINEAQHHLQQALRLEPENASTHAYYAEHQLFTRDFELGLFHADRAVELNPTLPDTYSTRSYLRAITGKLDAALKDAELSLQIDPYHTYMGWNAGEVYRMAGQYQRAIDAFRSVPHMPPSVQAETAACLAGLGLIDEARGEMRKFHHRAREQMAVYPKTETDWRHYWYQITPYEKDEDFEIFYDQLLQAGLCDQINQATEDIPSIAVLPFENMSGDPEQKYFSDGFTESIILNLGSFNEFRVKSKYASFSYTDSSKTFDEITRELDVQYIVEGSIRKFGDKVRITVQLEETDGGNQLWGKRFESELENLFSIEEELVQTIAGTISGRIGKELKSASLHKPAKDLKSYDYLLRGIYHLEKYNHKDNLIAQQQFQKCLEHDPDNAEAHAYLGAFYVIDIYENWSTDREESKHLMLIHAEKALELEPDNARAHAYIAETLMMHHEFDRAEVHADRAIELNPTLPDGYAIKGFVMGSTRRYAEAIENAEISLKIDPHHPYMAWSAGEVFRGCGQYERAVKTFRSMPHRSPSVYAQTAAALAGLGKIDEARSEMNRYLESARSHMPSLPTNEREWRSVWYDTMPYQYDEDADTLFELLLKAGLCDDLPEPTDDIPSIAVLPFENMSGDPEQEHFADGITTDIIATLSKFKNMRTVARYSILQYRDQKTSIADIAAQQKVRYILEGSVRKSGERIRVSAELIDSQNDQACWSERYDRDLDDLFAVQDEITRSIALAMKVQFDDGEMALHRSKGATSIRAWELTLTAVDLADTYIRQNVLDAREMVNQAIRLDPEYAYAWITLGWTYWQEAYAGWSDSIEELIGEAEKANQHAMSLDPNYGEAWILAGMNHQMKHESEAAIAACLKAVELEPGSSDVHALTAWAYLASNRPNWYYGVSGGIEKKCGNLDLAIELFQQGLEVEPEAALCRFLLIDALMEKGETARARRLAEEIRALDKSMSGKGMVQSNSYDAGERQRFHDNLAKFDLV